MVGVNDRLTWLRKFQQDVLQVFTLPIWLLPTESNPLPLEIEITSEQRGVLDDLAKPIYRLFKRHCKEKAKERHVHLSQVMTEMDIFTVCWPAIVNVFDKISKMIILEEHEQLARNLP